MPLNDLSTLNTPVTTFLNAVSDVQPYFFLFRVLFYVMIYLAWCPLLNLINPALSQVTLKQSHGLLVRLLVIYELLFGINLVAFVT